MSLADLAEARRLAPPLSRAGLLLRIVAQLESSSAVEITDALIVAIRHHDVPLIAAMLETASVDPNVPSSDGELPICVAIHKMRIDAVKILLEHGIDFSTRCPKFKNFTPLVAAADQSHRFMLDIVQLLAEHDDSDAEAALTAAKNRLAVAKRKREKKRCLLVINYLEGVLRGSGGAAAPNGSAFVDLT